MKKFYCQNNFCGKQFTLRGVFNKHCLLFLFSFAYEILVWQGKICFEFIHMFGSYILEHRMESCIMFTDNFQHFDMSNVDC